MKNRTILIDAPSQSWSNGHTDLELRREFERFMCDPDVEIPRSLLWNAVYNISFILSRILNRLSSNLSNMLMYASSRIRSYILRSMGADVVISQGPYPPVCASYNVIWETFFLSEDYTGVEDKTFCRGGKNFWVRQMEKFGPLVEIIAVRGSKSVALVKQLFPELKDKVVNLGFVRGEYDIIGEELIRMKQLEVDCVNILFVGHLAKAKGLGVLIDACKKLREKGVANFQLTVVSNLLNSRDIQIPNEPWIYWYKSLPNNSVLELMRKAQIFAMPSFVDTYGLVYHEAMAHGCVTCVRDGEPQREFVDYGKAGICLDYRDPNKVSEQLERIIDDRDLRLTLALAGYKRYREKYSQVKIRGEWRKVLGGVSRGPR